MFILVALSFTLCIIVFIYLILDTGNVLDALSFTVVLVVASVPLAMEMVTTTTLALGSQELSKHGVIVAKLAAIEDLASMSILCSDKTGTLTMNKMVIQEETPIYKEGETRASLLTYAAMAAKWKEPPKDALDTLVLGAVDMKSLENIELLNYMPFDPTQKRTEGTVRDNTTGKTFKTTKGAPNIILALLSKGKKHFSSSAFKKQVDNDIHGLGQRGIRALAVAKTDSADGDNWEFLGLLTFLDPPRADTKQTIEDAMKYGVTVKMITGDHVLIAKETAKALNLGDYVRSSDGLPSLDPETKHKPPNLARDYGDLCLAVDCFAQVYPEHKFLIVECLRDMHYKVGMTGDGVNDAPALKAADVGIAVEGATGNFCFISFPILFDSLIFFLFSFISFSFIN
jgi:H+-transporting ATPase